MSARFIGQWEIGRDIGQTVIWSPLTLKRAPNGKNPYKDVNNSITRFWLNNIWNTIPPLPTYQQSLPNTNTVRHILFVVFDEINGVDKHQDGRTCEKHTPIIGYCVWHPVFSAPPSDQCSRCCDKTTWFITAVNINSTIDIVRQGTEGCYYFEILC